MNYAIEQALESEVCGDIVVSTDSEEIADIARTAGAEVPFLRHGDTDDMTSCGAAAYNVVSRMKHELGRSFDVIGILLITSPLRTPEDIRHTYHRLMENDELDSCMTFTAQEQHPYWAWVDGGRDEMIPLFKEHYHLDREEVPKTYFADGAAYFARTPFFEKVKGNQQLGRIGAHYMDPAHSVDVDTPFDLELCRFLMRNGKPG